MKTPEELNALREEIKELNSRLAELSAEELEQVSGGWLDEDGKYICPRDYENMTAACLQSFGGKEGACPFVTKTGDHTYMCRKFSTIINVIL